MLVQDAKTIAQQWVKREASKLPGFAGAFFAGSVLWQADEAVIAPTSDVDLWLVLAGESATEKLGKLVYRGVILEVSALTLDQLGSPEQILADYHMAGHFRQPSVIADPTGRLREIQQAVAKEFAQRRWVVARCTQARDKISHNLQAPDPAAPLHDQVMSWAFSTGIMTHVLLVAGLQNPTIRKRYLAVRGLLAEYKQLAYYEELLGLLGCAAWSQDQTAAHLARLADLFEAAKTVAKTPFFFSADISDLARPVAIDGSRDLIEQGDHREAVFWIIATYCRCMKILHHDASPALQARFAPGFEQLLADLDIRSVADLHENCQRTLAALPALWQVTESILETNPAIEEKPSGS